MNLFSYAEAANRSSWKKWKQAIQEEEKGSPSNIRTWEIVDLPPESKTSFLNRDSEEEIYIDEPDGYIASG